MQNNFFNDISLRRKYFVCKFIKDSLTESGMSANIDTKDLDAFFSKSHKTLPLDTSQNN